MTAQSDTRRPSCGLRLALLALGLAASLAAYGGSEPGDGFAANGAWICGLGALAAVMPAGRALRRRFSTKASALNASKRGPKDPRTALDWGRLLHLSKKERAGNISRREDAELRELRYRQQDMNQSPVLAWLLRDGWR